MLQQIILIDVVQRTSQFPVTFYREILPLVIIVGKLTKTIGWFVVQYAHQTTCTDAVGTCTEVTTICETRVYQEVNVLSQLDIDLGVHVGAANA